MRQGSQSRSSSASSASSAVDSPAHIRSTAEDAEDAGDVDLPRRTTRIGFSKRFPVGSPDSQIPPNAHDVLECLDHRAGSCATRAAGLAIRNCDLMTADPVARPRRADDSFGFRKRRTGYKLEPLNYFTPYELHCARVIGFDAKQERRQRVECPGNKPAVRTVVLVLARRNDDIEAGG